MSTEAKKANQHVEALSDNEMSGVAGGGVGGSRDGSSGGPEFQANLKDTTRLAKPSKIL